MVSIEHQLPRSQGQAMSNILTRYTTAEPDFSKNIISRSKAICDILMLSCTVKLQMKFDFEKSLFCYLEKISIIQLDLKATQRTKVVEYYILFSAVHEKL